MNSNLFRFLSTFWEVEHRPRTHLSPEEEEMPLRVANMFWICITAVLLFLSVVFVAHGVMV